MSIEAYLTIDDSPSTDTRFLVDYLAEKNIQALLFCRGDYLEHNGPAMEYAVEHGMVLGNHAFSHTRFSTLTFMEGVEEIEETEALIEAVYAEAGVERPGKYFRFPHIDRGTGGYVVDYDAVPATYAEILKTLFGGGLNIELIPPSAALVRKKERWQRWLEGQGFEKPPFEKVDFEWYKNTEMAVAVDAFFTYSTNDWMLLPRHAGGWDYKTLDDLKRKIDDDPHLKREDTRHIILAHDQDGLAETIIPLLDHMLAKGVKFVDFVS